MMKKAMHMTGGYLSKGVAKGNDVIGLVYVWKISGSNEKLFSDSALLPSREAGNGVGGAGFTSFYTMCNV